jgi:hypothetical protein
MFDKISRYYEACGRHDYFDLVFLSLSHEGRDPRPFEAVLHLTLARRGPVVAGEDWLLEIRFRDVRDLTLTQPPTMPMSIHPLLIDSHDGGFKVRDCEEQSLRFLCRDFELSEKASPLQIGSLPVVDKLENGRSR